MAVDANRVRRALVLRGALDKLEAELGRKWTEADSLPPCPDCGCPFSPGLVGGVLCIAGHGLARPPHARRLQLWRRARSN